MVLVAGECGVAHRLFNRWKPLVFKKTLQRETSSSSQTMEARGPSGGIGSVLRCSFPLLVAQVTVIAVISDIFSDISLTSSLIYSHHERGTSN